MCFFVWMKIFKFVFTTLRRISVLFQASSSCQKDRRRLAMPAMYNIHLAKMFRKKHIDLNYACTFIWFPYLPFSVLIWSLFIGTRDRVPALATRCHGMPARNKESSYCRVSSWRWGPQTVVSKVCHSQLSAREHILYQCITSRSVQRHETKLCCIK